MRLCVYPALTFIVLVLSSCGIYRQNVVNVPMFTRQGEIQASAHAGFNGTEAQLAAAPLKGLAIVADYCFPYTRKRNYSQINFERTGHYFFETGLGVFRPRAESAHRSRELFLLAGRGQTSHFVQFNDSGKTKTSFQEVSYDRVVLQGDIGTGNDKLTIAFSPRLVFVNYHSFTDTEKNDFRHLKNSYLYVESAFTLKYAFVKWLALNLQLCATLSVTDKAERGYNYYYDFSPVNVTAGIVFCLHPKIKETK